jgi:biopolymer transport protein ExbB/TolQ
MDLVSDAKAVMLSTGAAPLMYLMVALSVLSFAVILERMWFFARTSVRLERLAARLRALLFEDDVEGANQQMGDSRSVEAAVIQSGLAKVSWGSRAAALEMESALALQRVRMERGLAYLGTLGNNAPFIGLLGTVAGIIAAFEKLGEAGANNSGSAQVMSSIAEALVTTAIGLVVAIPAVAAYNVFQRRIKTVTSNAEALSRILLSWMASKEDRSASTTARLSHAAGGVAKVAVWSRPVGAGEAPSGEAA